jgi:hypothetical protein
MPEYNVIANANPKNAVFTVAARPPIYPGDVVLGMLVSSETDPEKLRKHAEECIGPLRLLVQIGDSWLAEAELFPLSESGLETAAFHADAIAGKHAVKLVAVASPDIAIKVWPKTG